MKTNRYFGKNITIIPNMKIFHLLCPLRRSLLLVWFISSISFAQVKKNRTEVVDSNTKLSQTEKIRRSTKISFESNKRAFSDKQKAALQKEKVSLLYKKAKETEDYIYKVVDTASITEGLPYLEDLYQVATTDVFYSKNDFLSARNLATTKLLLKEISKKLQTINKTLLSFQTNVSGRRKALDSLAADSVLYLLPSDTLLYGQYEKSFELVLNDLSPIDNLLNTTIEGLNSIDKRVSSLNDAIHFDIQKIENYQDNLSTTILKKDISLFTSNSKSYKPITETISFSALKAFYVFLFFIENHSGKLILLTLLFLFTYYFFFKLRKRLQFNAEGSVTEKQTEPFQHPLLSALLVNLTIDQLLLGYLPFIISAILWISLSFILLVIQDPGKTFHRSKLHMSIFLIYVLVILNNFLLDPSSAEILFIFISSISSIIFAFIFIKRNKDIYSRFLFVKLSLQLFVILESGAFIALILGRYNFSKILLTTGYSEIIAGLFIYAAYNIGINALNLYSRLFGSQDSKNIFVQLKSLNDSKPWLLKSLMILIWSVLFLRNFYLYFIISEQFYEIIVAKRTLGQYTFSFESVLVFITIIVSSAFLSKVISLIAGSSNSFIGGPIQKKGGIGNFLLLFRLAIIMAGTILAFAASGIPMDRLTIILGSLGIGIGFGLQGIFGNLISGVILAFERPIEIGDQIEVVGKTGRIKEIGIRSSKMVSLDGAEIIIPNNDLISQQLINWTLSNNHRRVELIVGVKYGTELSKAKQLLEEILHSNNTIEKNPAPSVFLNEFNSSSIDFRLLFWSDINNWLVAKSEVILSIDTAFREQGIQIPFPQQDIYIKELPKKDGGESPK